jgi:hypothetical protein
MSVLVANLDQEASRQERQMEVVNSFLRSRQIPKDLQTRVRDYYRYLWKHQVSGLRFEGSRFGGVTLFSGRLLRCPRLLPLLVDASGRSCFWRVLDWWGLGFWIVGFGVWPALWGQWLPIETWRPLPLFVEASGESLAVCGFWVLAVLIGFLALVAAF